MKIRKVPIARINPATYNPRKDLQPEDPEYQKLKQSIINFGYVDPLVWNERTGNLVSGHQRLKIIIEQGFKEIQVSVVNLSPDQEKLLNLALNKISGQWHEDKLGSLIDELSKIPDLDLSLSGFDTTEVSEILDGITGVPDDDFNFDEEIKNIGKSITQPGDLIILGNHRLLCGDSTNPDDIKRLIEDKRIDLVFTDPPYNVDYYGGNRPNPEKSRPKPSRNWQRIYNDNLTQEEYEMWLKQIISNISSYLSNGASCYLWNGHRQFGPMYQMLTELGFHVSCVITWAKQNFAIGFGDYNQQTEFCLYSWKVDNGAHRWYGPTNESTLWQVKRDPTKDYFHPTQKPLELAHRALRNSSQRGDIVLDVFLGSGTTLIAAEKLKRICYGMEISPLYCDVAVRRFIKTFGAESVSEEIRKKYQLEGGLM